MVGLEETLARIVPLDEAAMAAMRQRLDQLTKPPGSLGRLEELAVQLAGVFGTTDLRVERKVVVVAAGDHGVTAEGVSAYPQEVTGQMLALFSAGRAAINVLARTTGAQVIVVDAGVASPAAELADRVIPLRLGAGTRNFRREPAMSHEQATRALEAGTAIAEEAVVRGAQVLATGDMGIGNTTAAAAVVAALVGVEPGQVVGRGTGIDDEVLERKGAVVREALALHRVRSTDPLGVLGAVGGFEIGVLAGVILGGAACRCPVVLDGVVSGAAALVAAGLASRATAYLIAGHLSTEPAHPIALQRLGLEPLLDLQLRLGEGTGAVLAFPLIDAAAHVTTEMWTFAEAGVSGKG